MSGLDQLLSRDQLPYPNARVGFLGHHASITRDQKHAVECLIERGEWQITKLFSPEHGFFGNAAAGEKVDNALHPKWQIPVFSLYGEHRKPPTEWLADLDLMVIDLQDLGVRCYTYASTLYLTMQACTETGVSIMVLDRTSPLSGTVDGPALDPAHRSFVGMIDLPLVYGKSQGELAKFLKSHASELRKLNLQIFRGSENPPTFKNWVPPSPAITSVETARLYPITVWCEAIPDVWVARGEAESFQVWCMPDFPEALLNNPPPFSGVNAVATQCQTPEGPWQGLKFTINPDQPYKPIQTAVQLLCALRDEIGSERLFACEGARPEFFDQLMGTASVREQIIAGKSASEICSTW